MATMATLNSSMYNKNLPQTLSNMNINDNNLRDASFSSYLKEENFVRKLAESNKSSQTKDQEVDSYNLGSKKEEEAEIGVFGAEKYFNGRIDDDSSTPRIHCKVDPKTLKCTKERNEENEAVGPVKSKAGTPSVRSESSWNSQSALLQNVLIRNSSRRKPNKTNRKRFLANLCSCTDKDSVDIDEHVGEISFSNPLVVRNTSTNSKHDIHPTNEDLLGLTRENCFTFSTMKPDTVNTNLLPVKPKFNEAELELERKSIEVFGSSLLDKRTKSMSIERRLTMLSWDHPTPKPEERETSTGYNDAASDASSDLFEIESVTGKINPFLARQASDGIGSGCVTPTTCYAPSEASVDWSVVTASAVDFSVVSDYEDRMMTMTRTTTTTSPPLRNVSVNNRSVIQRRRPGILLGCKNQKAVKVVGDAYITNPKTDHKKIYESKIRQASEPFTSVTRFQVETKLSSIESSRNRARSQIAAGSHLLYIQ